MNRKVGFRNMDFEEILKSTILEALIEKIISVQNTNINYPAINAFSKLITDEPESASLAIQLIICKIQSSKEWEVMQTLNLLETCLENNCDALLTEVGKFRFLNEVIKLVSPKYLGNDTPAVIKEKIVGLLKSWSLKYPRETKIRDAYEMLVHEKITPADPVTPSSFSRLGTPNSSKSSLYEDDVEKSQMLRKLLRSSKPDDLKAANLLIQTMVKEKEEKEDLRLIENNTKLLSEMLSNLNPDSSPEDFQLIRELKETCVNMKPTLTYMISSSNKTSRESAELFNINDFLNDTLLYYHQVMQDHKNSTNSTSVCEITRTSDSSIAHSSSPTLLDFGSLMDDNSLIFPCNPVNGRPNLLNSEPLETSKAESSVEALKDVFKSTFNVLDDKKNDSDTSVSSEHKSVDSTKLFQDLNALGKSLLESTKAENMNPRDEMTMTINDPVIQTNSKDFSGTAGLIESDSKLLDGLDKLVIDNNRQESDGSLEPLSDVSVPLVDIRTENGEKFTAFEDPDGIAVYIQLTKNKPRKDVSVFLVLANSKQSRIITSFLFQPVVPKDCRLKLQPPSRTELPPYNPYIPMDTIVQVMLIASFKKDFIPLKFVISYNIQDEMITEMGEVPKLPLN